MERTSKNRKWNTTRSLAAGVITLVACAVSLGMGRFRIAPGNVMRAICDVLIGSETVSETIRHVVCFVRVPRILGALLCGAGLAVAGAGFQAVFANPLATPDTLGVGNAASFGAVAAILEGAGRTGIQSSALVFGLFSVCLVYLFAGRSGEQKALRLVLSGMVVGAFFSSMVSFAKYAADPQDELPSITYWLLGSLKNMSWPLFLSGAGWIIAGIIVLVLLRWKLDALMLSEEEIRSFGISVRGLSLLVIAASSAITAAVVSMCGQIGWIGLLIPHLCRMLYGGSNKDVIPSSIAYGALFLLVTDTAARCITASEIPAAILTSLIGAPLFLFLLARTGGLRS